MSDRLKILLMLLPTITVIGGLFFGGLFVAALRSLNYMPVIGLTEPGFEAYWAVLRDPDVHLSLALSLYIAAVSTFVASVLALGAALMLRRHFTGRALANFLFQMNLTVPHLVGGIGILYLFSQSGSFARLASELRLIAGPGDFPALVFDPYAIGIILTYVWKELPFIGVILLAQLQVLGEDHESVARSLGASPWQSFRHVLLPMIAPGLLAASVIVFAFTFGAYEIPALLGENHPVALPVLAYRRYTDVDLAERPEAMALAVLIAAISALLLYIYMRLLRRHPWG